MKAKSTDKNRIWLFIGLAFVIFFGLIPAPEGLTRLSMQVAGIFIGTIILWLAVAPDWPSLLCVVALLLIGATEPTTAFSTLLGNSTCAFLIFSYMLASGLVHSGVLKRCAVWFISRKITQKSPWMLIFMIMLCCLVVGLVMIPSTMIIIFLPIVEQIFKQAKLKCGDRLAELIVLLMAFTGSIAQGMTPIGHAHPLIAMSLLEQSTGYAMQHSTYMLFAIPTGIVAIALMFLYFRYAVSPDVSALAEVDTDEIKNSMQPMSSQEKVTLIIFCTVVLWWLAPSILQIFWKPAADAINAVGNVVPPMVGVMLMCIMRMDGKPLLNFKEAVKEIPWTVIFMVGATMVLSAAITSDASGLGNWISTSVGASIGKRVPFMIIVVAVIWIVLQTNFSSNAVSVTLVFSIMIPLAIASPELINPNALTAVLASSCCYAFATPLSTAVIAIVSGTEWVSGHAVWRHGLVMMLITIIVFIAIGYPLASLLFPI